MKHKHRIIPGYEGGEYTDGNVINLTPTQHAMWHFAEWQRKGNWQDKLAWQRLIAQCTNEEAVRIAQSEGGKKGGRAIPSVEARKKMSEWQKGEKHYRFGQPLPDEHRANISRGRTGIKLSEETKRKIGEARKGRTPWNKGKSTSEEIKKKISDSKKRRVK